MLTTIIAMPRTTCQRAASPVAIRIDMRMGANGGRMERNVVDGLDTTVTTIRTHDADDRLFLPGN